MISIKKITKVNFLALFIVIGTSLCAEDQKSANLKIFQIGFNKCGTLSLSNFFQENNIKSIHWEKGAIARSIYKNHLNNSMLISNDYDDVVAFFDMEFASEKIYIAQQLFKELDLQYPGSKFILNTRDKKKWLKSRVMHGKKNYLERCAEAYGLSLSEMFSQWSQEWDQHHANVLAYFKNRPEDLIVFDIENDPISKLCEFFKPYYFLDPSHYKHLHMTSLTSTKLEQLFERLYKDCL